MLMRKIRNFCTLALAVLMVAALVAGCGSKPAATAENNAPKPAEGQNKVACILSGPISDMSWNATAYNGMLEIEKLGAQISYQENVENSSLADSINTYATGGYNIIFLSTNSYEDIALQEAPNYPDVTFMIINGTTTKDNVVSIQIADEQQGFMMGAIAALTAGEGQVGFVGGMEITPIINGGKGFELGAKYVKENIIVNSAMTGSMTDVNKAKETAKAMVDKGATVMAPMADNASLGVLEAAQEGKALAVASGLNQEKVAPDAVLLAVVKDTAIAYKAAYETYLSGNLPTETKKMGVAEGVVFLSDWYPAANSLSQETKNQIKQIYDDLVAGKINVTVS